MKKIILVRHTNNRIEEDATTKPNDYVLTKVGINQAKEIKDYLKNQTYQCIFTSLYSRTIEVAEIIRSNKSIRIINTNSFNEYFQRPDGAGVETTEEGISRAMVKIFSLFDVYDEIVIVGHVSINQSIMYTLLNIEYSESLKYFKNYGETHILRNDYKQGDKKWNIIDSFTPKQ